MVSIRPHLARVLTRPVLLAAGALLALGGPAPTRQAPEADRILDGWFATQAGLRSWSAEFTQTRTLPTIRRPLTAKGRLWFAPPDRFRWELGEPPRTIAVRRDTNLWLLYPRLRRIEHYPLDEDPRSPWRSAVALIEAAMPRERAAFERGFTVESVTTSNGLHRIAFKPRAAAARHFLAGLSLELATNDFSLRANALRFVDGSVLRNDYSNGIVNPPLDPKLFTVSTNAGWQVVEPARER